MWMTRTISGTAIITTGEGDITATNLLVSETGDADIKSIGDGNILITDSELNGDADITADGEGSITLRDLAIGGTAVISNDRNLTGAITGNGIGNVDMEKSLMSGKPKSPPAAAMQIWTCLRLRSRGNWILIQAQAM